MMRGVGERSAPDQPGGITGDQLPPRLLAGVLGELGADLSRRSDEAYINALTSPRQNSQAFPLLRRSPA